MKEEITKHDWAAAKRDTTASALEWLLGDKGWFGCDQVGPYWRQHVPGRWSHWLKKISGKLQPAWGTPLLLHVHVCLLALPSPQAWLWISSSCQCLPSQWQVPAPAWAVASHGQEPRSNQSVSGCVTVLTSPSSCSSPSTRSWPGMGIGAFSEAQGYSECSCHHARVTCFLAWKVLSTCL